MTNKFSKPNCYLLSLFVFLFAGFNHAAVAQQPVVVKTYGQHIGGNIVYQQQVTNNGIRDVVGIAIAEDTDQEGISGGTRDSGELDAFPVGSDMIHTKVNPASISGPAGWTGSIIQIQDSGLFFQWDSPGHPQPSIQPGQTVRFSITVPKYDEAYLTGHFSAGFGDGNDPWYYNGVMEKLDTTPPTLTVSLSPVTLSPPSGNLVPIIPAITVNDDYDPSPDIKLESITANEPLADGDIQDTQLGTDDRSFSLAAKRADTNPAGRTYTVTYSATDASGNKATASATVTVPYN